MFLRAWYTATPPQLQMITTSTGLAVFKHRPRGSTTERFEIRIYQKDPVFGGWDIIVLPDTYATQDEAITQAKAYLTSVDEQVWPKSVDTKRKKT